MVTKLEGNNPDKKLLADIIGRKEISTILSPNAQKEVQVILDALDGVSMESRDRMLSGLTDAMTQRVMLQVRGIIKYGTHTSTRYPGASAQLTRMMFDIQSQESTAERV